MHFLFKLHKRIIFVHFYDRVGVLKTFDQNKNISNKLTDDYLSIITPPSRGKKLKTHLRNKRSNSTDFPKAGY